MSESRDWIRDQIEGQPGFVAPSAEQERYAGGAPGGEDEAEQDQEQAEEQAPWMADRAFFDALTEAAQQDMLAGADMSAEFDLWTRGEVDTGGQDTEYEVEDYEPAMTADEQAEQVRIWTEIAMQGGTSDVSAEAAISYADQWAYSARAAALGEVRAGRRSAHDLTGDDERDYVQAEINDRVAAGKARWGER